MNMDRGLSNYLFFDTLDSKQDLQSSLGKEEEKSGEAHSHFLNVVPGIKCGTLAVFLTLGARVANAWGLV